MTADQPTPSPLQHHHPHISRCSSYTFFHHLQPYTTLLVCDPPLAGVFCTFDFASSVRATSPSSCSSFPPTFSLCHSPAAARHTSFAQAKNTQSCSLVEAADNSLASSFCTHSRAVSRRFSTCEPGLFIARLFISASDDCAPILRVAKCWRHE